jgi:hypothetical protein
VFGDGKPEWYVFPAGKGQPNDPTKPVTTLRTAWTKARDNANVVGRWPDNPHTLVTEPAESGAGDEGDHEHRRPRLSRNAPAVFPCAHGKRNGAHLTRLRHGSEQRRRNAVRPTSGCAGMIRRLNPHFSGDSCLAAANLILRITLGGAA